MPNIATVLKQEIARLARKEVKAQTETMRKASAQYRRDIAGLKRTVATLERQVTVLKGRERRRGVAVTPKTTVKGRRFSAARLNAHRTKLGLSAADYGKLVGVTGQTIYSWEQGKSRPREQQLAALVAARDLGKREAQQRLELLDR